MLVKPYISSQLLCTSRWIIPRYFQDKLGFLLEVNELSATPRSLCWERAVRKYAAPRKKSPVL
ncbi:unnamed protein product [Staurois parvus]|uniref:Uncharacterized protein n=1 Tax=Staurois parvus TaxID=386267 RepID=A0ABN9BXM9_9NEOB|nr:unnamed protein product [Staurois parvus]